MLRLKVLQDDVAARTAAIRSTHGCWPCARGCDSCCRNLARIPVLTWEEWKEVRSAFLALPAAVREDVLVRAEALRAKPLVCPFLQEQEGICRIYESRPIACRTYGFYQERDGGLYCSAVQGLVESGECDHVVWGNGEAIERRLEALGQRRDLCGWLRTLAGQA